MGSELSKKIQSPPNDYTLQMPKMNQELIFLYPTDYLEIMKIIENMALKNGGIDQINAKTLKILTNFIVNPLAHIFNLCMKKAVWPIALKNAEIIPI